MIYDMTQILLSLSSTYTRITHESFTYNGITYTNPVSNSTIRGVLVPLTSDDRMELLGLGHTINGKQNFYVPISEGILTINDSIIDADGVEWKVEPHNSSYAETCALIKYRVTRKIV